MGFVDWPIIEVFIPLVIPIILVTYSKAKYRDFCKYKDFFSSLLAIRGRKKRPKTHSIFYFLISNFTFFGEISPIKKKKEAGICMG